MKLAWVGWLLAGSVAFGLGAVAEACGGSVETGGNPPGCIGCGTSPTPPSSTTPTGPGPDCPELLACCNSLPPSALNACVTLATSGSSAACAAELAQLYASGYCGSTGTGTGTATSTAIGTSTATSTSSTIGPGDSGSPCHKAPPALHPETAPGVYCPFEGAGFGANCIPDQHCCEPPAGASSCIVDSIACPAGDTDWQCDGPLDCPGSDAGALVCCGTGTIDMQEPCGPVPAYPYVSGFKGSTCATACNTGMFNGGMLGFVVCSQQSECAVGTCTPIDPKGGGTGYCAGADGSPVFGSGTGSGT